MGQVHEMISIKGQGHEIVHHRVLIEHQQQHDQSKGTGSPDYIKIKLFGDSSILSTDSTDIMS